MAGNRNWVAEEDAIVLRLKQRSPEEIQKALDVVGYKRTWGAVRSRWEWLTGRRKREGYGRYTPPKAAAIRALET